MDPLTVARSITQQPGILVDAGKLAPPGLARSACLYLIETQGKYAGRWYVGESRNVLNRDRQHLLRFQDCRRYIFPAADKAEALQWEVRVIRRSLKTRLVNFKDGQRGL